MELDKKNMLLALSRCKKYRSEGWTLKLKQMSAEQIKALYISFRRRGLI